MAGIYIHFPFCISKCSYCDFYSVIYSEKIVPKFIKCLKKEIRMRYSFFPASTKIDSIYFGGGTPSLLHPDAIKSIIKNISSYFDLSENSELSLEINPGTVSSSKLKKIMAAGINRLSIGAQSFDNQELKFLSRIHNSSEIEATLKYSLKTGFKNIGFDLIFGLPGQKIDTWKKTLLKAVSMQPTHISAYSLSWSRKTPLGKKIESGKIPTPEEKNISEMFLLAHNILTEKGYEHYEISNYALPEYRCLHNEGYWKDQPYLGIGPSAHSYTGDRRSWNISDVDKYISLLSQSVLPAAGEEKLNQEQKRMETIAVGLRRQEGIEIKKNSIDPLKIEDYVKKGLIDLKGDRISLTPSGLLLTDEIALNFI